jgi:hypothetical protein
MGRKMQREREEQMEADRVKDLFSLVSRAQIRHPIKIKNKKKCFLLSI